MADDPLKRYDDDKDKEPEEIPKKGKHKVKEPKTVRIGDSSYELVYAMLTGIRTTVGKISADQSREIWSQDFEEIQTLHMLRSGTPTTPASSYDFKFKSFAPIIFRALREKFGIDPADYLVSLTQDYILTELITPGKSGSFFYYSYDYRFILKTVSNSECYYLRQILPQYYEHVMSNPNTMLTRFFGLHRVRIHKGNVINFVVMGNVFVPDREIHERFDLKGSSVGRAATAPQKLKPDCIFKDLDFGGHRKIKLGPIKAKLFFDQLENDTTFLRDLKIMDYSLLLGTHYRGRANSVKQINLQERSVAVATTEKEKKRFSITTVKGDILPPFPIKRERMSCVFQQDEGGFASTNNNNEETNELYFMGIIDILQPYDLRKWLEHSIKSVRYDRHRISAVNPREYCARLLDFIKRNTGNEEIPGTSSPNNVNIITSPTTTATSTTTTTTNTTIATTATTTTQDVELNAQKTGNS